MCGIVGYSASSDVTQDLITALRTMEYRGYDSAGIAVSGAKGPVRLRAKGKLAALEAKLSETPLSGKVGIGHTRWATHGPATEANAHPHSAQGVSLVHNGIIENYAALKAQLQKPSALTSDTDTEIVAHLMGEKLAGNLSADQAFGQTLGQLQGAFALAALLDLMPDTLFIARRGSPLVVGLSNDRVSVASDPLALIGKADEVIFLEEGDWGMLTPGHIELFNAAGDAVERPRQAAPRSAAAADKGPYRHFMLKEIFEQPEAIAHTLAHYIDPDKAGIAVPDPSLDLGTVERVLLVACGTAAYAGLTAKYWIENWARVPVEVDIASEFRYRKPVITDGTLTIVISQSGETADTIAALQHVQTGGGKVAAVVNVPHSTMARDADHILPTHAGPEIGVASTKAFVCQLAALACFAAALGEAKGQGTDTDDIRGSLLSLPRRINAILEAREPIKSIARSLKTARHVLFVGRGITFPIALEGALKLKELSYIHAEGYAAGELKHGPIALIDADMPVIGLAPKALLFEKTISNLEQIAARGGQVHLLSDGNASVKLASHFEMPAVNNVTAPFLYAIPAQLLAYYTALEKGTDVDQPRNLAKSVTVE